MSLISIAESARNASCRPPHLGNAGSDLQALPRPQTHPGTGRQRAEVRTRPDTDGVLVKALARAWRWQKLLDGGAYSTVTEIAEAERLSE